ncbi:MAG TPA: thiamine pyrophosphate-dependent enzyme, partial [Novosphingobium sp.]|nr:thiamine pyrophosphate-dependent enzyme [Novosphingobium sp.]
LADLARAMAAPVVLTPGAGGVAPGLEAHSFPYGFSPVAAEIVAASDVVLAVGTQLGEQVHFGQGRHWRAGDGQRRWIHIEQDGPAIGGNRPIDVALAGDLAAILPQLSGRLARAAGADLARWSAAEAARRAALAQGPSAGAGPLHPARLVVEATRALPQEAILVRDGGAFVLFQLAYGQGHPRDVLWSQNLAHLGTGLPYAIGAAQATGGQRPVVLLTSDSALLFHIAELETAARLGLPILCVVAVDHQWGLEAGMYRRLHGPATPEPGAHWSRDVRFDRIARGLACPASQVTQAQEIAPAMAAALAAGGPYLLHVPIDAAANAGEIPAFAEFASWYAQA